VRPIPRNSWGGASQALTALRAPRWMEFYGKSVEMGQMMEAWCKALIADGTFRQQLDPMTGVFTEGGSKGYSPAALVLVDYTWRLAGVREGEGGIEWNVRPGSVAAEGARFSLKTKSGKVAEMRYGKGGTELRLGVRPFATVWGTVRIKTFEEMFALSLTGIAATTQRVKILWANGQIETHTIKPNEGEINYVEL
jgi:hypothetical protein